MFRLRAWDGGKHGQMEALGASHALLNMSGRPAASRSLQPIAGLAVRFSDSQENLREKERI
jgi:hypothetical protein